MHRRLVAWLSQLVFSGESNSNLQWETSQWNKTIVTNLKQTNTQQQHQNTNTHTHHKKKRKEKKNTYKNKVKPGVWLMTHKVKVSPSGWRIRKTIRTWVIAVSLSSKCQREEDNPQHCIQRSNRIQLSQSTTSVFIVMSKSFCRRIINVLVIGL